MSLKEIVKGSVAILQPCANSVEPKAHQFGMVVVSGSWAAGIPIREIGVTERTLIHTARNVLAAQFLETDCEWAFWMDSDMILPQNTIPHMMSWAKKLGAQFLTGIYYQRIGKHNPLILIRDEAIRKYEDGFSHSMIIPPDNCITPFKVHCCGFGCVLMHRDVLIKLDEPYFKVEYISKTKELSEDFYFCLKAKEAGIDLWAVPGLDCGHLGEAKIITKKDFKDDGNTLKYRIESAVIQPTKEIARDLGRAPVESLSGVPANIKNEKERHYDSVL